MKNKRKVTAAAMWWNQRRPEIVEDFDREIYGRVPKNKYGVLSILLAVSLGPAARPDYDIMCEPGPY